MLNKDEIYNSIHSQISVTRSQIIVAKKYILKIAKESYQLVVKDILQNFLVSVDAIAPKEVIIHPSIDSTPMIRKVVQNISWQSAFSEAVWSLIHSNILLPLDSTFHEDEPHIPWTTVVPGRGGQSSRWNFPDWRYSIPNRLKLAPSIKDEKREYLIEPDLFLENLEIKNLHPEIEDALKDAVRCFRADLFTPCLAMLAKATEGAWVELGLYLINSIPEKEQGKVKKQLEGITDEYSSFTKKINSVLELFERQDLFCDISKISKVKLQDIRNASLWADCVRESRNVVHYGYEASLPNNFEKVSTVLLGVPSHFKLIYRLIEATKNISVK